MLIPLTAEWRVDRERKRRAGAFLAALRREPDDADVRWLADAAAQGDVDHARWELRYARLALGVLTAQRDALDDRTSSDVVAALAVALRDDPGVAPDLRVLAEKQFNDRLGAYREALNAHGGSVGAGERLGRVLLAFASDGARSAGTPLARAVELLSGYVAEANQSLRDVYGAAQLPEHLPPSELGAIKG
ncbi:MAG: hypothetical protein HY084_01955 [Gemmatimonadetes bacterium]|nr:hypothetical protein [Gemmatimonadota bacterium]